VYKLFTASALCFGVIAASATAASACFDISGPAGGCYQTVYTYCSYNADGSNCCFLAHVRVNKITVQDC
jgi:hypothetical protein